MFYDFIIKYTDIFCWKKKQEKLLQSYHILSTKNIGIFQIVNIWNYNKMLTNDVVVLNNWALILVSSVCSSFSVDFCGILCVWWFELVQITDVSSYTARESPLCPGCQLYRWKRMVSAWNTSQGKWIHFQGKQLYLCHYWLSFQKRSTLKGKNLLQREQILFLIKNWS